MSEREADQIIRAETSTPAEPTPAARARGADPTLNRVRFIAEFLDQRFRIPGTRIRFGYDAVIGLLPGIGDTLTAAIGFSIVLEAIRRRVGWGVVAKMILNLIFDWLIGLIPIIDLLLDVAFKANVRNVRLLERELEIRRMGAAETTP